MLKLNELNERLFYYLFFSFECNCGVMNGVDQKLAKERNLCYPCMLQTWHLTIGTARI